jgi:hypothetical protein
MHILPRLAIGISQNPTAFDGSGVASLCWTDPFVDDNLIALKIAEEIVPELTLRKVTKRTAPRAMRRTGFGVWFTLDVEMLFETSRVKPPGFIPNTYPNPSLPQPYVDAEIDEGVIPTIANFLGFSSSGLNPDPNGPYFFLNVNYLTPYSTWIPVELHPDKSDFAPAYEAKTILRKLPLSFISQQTYKAISRDIVPAKAVTQLFLPDGTTYNTVRSLPNPPSGTGPYTGIIMLDYGLPAKASVGDILALRFHLKTNASYAPYYTFTITSISTNRQQVQFTTPTLWPIGIPNAAWDAPTVRLMKDDPFFRMYVYSFLAFDSLGGIGGFPIQAGGGTKMPSANNRRYFESPHGNRDSSNKMFTTDFGIIAGTEEIWYKNAPLARGNYTLQPSGFTLGAAIDAPVTYPDSTVDPLLISYDYPA